MKSGIKISTVLMLLAGLLFASEWEFENVFFDFNLEYSGSVGIQGLAVDGDGNIWYALYGQPTGWYTNDNNDSLEVYQIFIKTPEGLALSFSPISSLNIEGTDYPLVSGPRGMATDPDGNIIYSVAGTVYKINHIDGSGIAVFDFPDVTTSLTKAAVDENGWVYIAAVSPGHPVYILYADLTPIATTIAELSGAFSRALAVSPDGRDLYVGSTWNGMGIRHYHSVLPGILPHEFVKYIGGWFMGADSSSFQELWPEDVAFGPDGLLYAANTQIDYSGDETHGSRWYIYDPESGAEVGDFGVPAGDPSAGGVWNGRGIDWDPSGSTMYIGDFGYNTVSVWTRTDLIDSTFYLTPGTVQIIPGDTVSIPITVTTPNDRSLNSFDMQFQVQNQNLELLGMETSGTALEAYGWNTEQNIQDGIVFISAAGANGILGSGVLFSLIATVSETTQPGFIPLLLESVVLNAGEELVVETGGVQVLGDGYATLDVDTVDVPAGESWLLPIQVYIEAPLQINSFDLSIEGIAGDLEFSGLASTGLIQAANWLVETNYQNGVLYVSAAGAEAIIGSGALFQIQIHVPFDAVEHFQPVWISTARINAGIDCMDANSGGVNITPPVPRTLLHVSAESGSDETGTGALNNPFMTIQHAVNMSNWGDTVLVHEGLYYENILMPNRDLVLASEYLFDPQDDHIAATIIDGSASGSVVQYQFSNTHASRLQGFTIQNGRSHHGGGISCVNSSPSISDCVIRNNQTSTSMQWGSSGGGLYFRASQSQLENLLIKDNVGYATYAEEGGGGGVALDVNSTLAMEDCVIRNNTSSPYGGGISMIGSMLSLNHCTLADNASNWGGSQLWLGDANICTILNSILDGPSSIVEIVDQGFCELVIDYSAITGGLTSIVNNGLVPVTWGDHCVAATDPLFCDPESEMYTLAENSPCATSGEMGTYMGALPVGCGPIVTIDDPLIPTEFSLEPNFPNPFNPTTMLRFGLPEAGWVQLSIVNVLGREVRTLVGGDLPAGWHTQAWEGLNEAGEPVPAGMYFAVLKADAQTGTIKMLLLK